ncbi:DUF6449 domain-containing protein [Ruminiclostridium cellulolyticum]|uniref:DUF6449 domain-containing protein n=1 Tax=Ruminiclostridium cellulolyticum (strain ATCC 35319 / DSM 5812 / JCM 6584 / H10) TaxID=394503 RepID=B8I6U2_RUMCH|nr:DUF6449 domain-containing protein [Ruminiclostridium cellulolyticum]ACL76934.1 conserved hypothetical protein [Ruminiclostridium cellulolyticum H10]
MKSKTSLFKKGLILSDLKRYWWVSVIFSLGLILAMPLAHYMQKFNINDDKSNIQFIEELISRELNFDSGISTLFPVVIPVIIAVLAYRYIQKGRQASLYHSLPVTRATLFFNSLVSSLILYILPLLINVFVMGLLNSFSFLSDFYTMGLIFKWLGLAVFYGILFMSMTIFVGMFTGSSVAQIVFVYILNLLPLFFFEVIRANLSSFLYGFATYSNTGFYRKLPMTMLLSNSIELSPQMVVGYIVLSVLLLAGGLVAFKLRRPETAGDIITFKPIRPVFIYGVTVCATLVGGSYFLNISRSSLPFAIFGYFLSALIGYVVVQMITNKTFKVLNTYKGYLGYALVLIIILLGIKFDIFGYVNKVPAADEVANVYMGYNIYWWENRDSENYIGPSHDNTTLYKETANIKSITELHKMILENRSKEGSSTYIAYTLKNGKKVVRYYTLDTNLYASALGPIYESKEYKNGRFPVLHQEADDIKYIQVRDYVNNKQPIVISDKEKLKSFITEIRKDINSFNYEQLSNQADDKLWIEISDNNDRIISYGVNSNYMNTLKWFSDNDK